jgi:EpsI family protein
MMIAIRVPKIPLRVALQVCAALIAGAVFASLITPKLSFVSSDVKFEATVPHSFGDWTELASPYSQVSLSTADGINMDQPYDQTLMRTYVNSKGQVVMLALAWGARQRQEIKVHRPDLCYIAQGFQVRSLAPTVFADISSSNGPVTGKRMTAFSQFSGEAVSYWIRIGNVYSEDAMTTRLHILKEGLSGRVPDGILVRASQHITSSEEAAQAWPVLESFLTELTAALPPETRALLVR